MNSLASIALFIAAGIFAALALASMLLAAFIKREIKQVEAAPSTPTDAPASYVSHDRALAIYEPSLRRYRVEDLHRDPNLIN